MNHLDSLAMPPRMSRSTYRIRRRIWRPVCFWHRTLGMKPQWAQHTRCKTSRPRDSRLRTSRTSSSGAELVQQRLGVLQIGGLEALGEPVVDLGDHRARLVAAIGVAHEPRETGRRTQLPPHCTLPERDLYHLAERGRRLMAKGCFHSADPPFAISMFGFPKALASGMTSRIGTTARNRIDFQMHSNKV